MLLKLTMTLANCCVFYPALVLRYDSSRVVIHHLPLVLPLRRT